MPDRSVASRAAEGALIVLSARTRKSTVSPFAEQRLLTSATGRRIGAAISVIFSRRVQGKVDAWKNEEWGGDRRQDRAEDSGCESGEKQAM